MLSKILISCALFVAVQASYRPYAGRSSNAGYAAQLQPAVTLTVLPSYGSYNSVPAYGAAPAYGSPVTYAVPSYDSPQRYGGVDAGALRLAKLALSLPTPSGTNTATINIPRYHDTFYTAPVAAPSSLYGDAGQSAAVAASNVKSAGSGYGHAPASSGYAPAARY